MTVTFGPFEVDSDRRLLLKNGGEVHLTPKAFDLFAVLLAEAPRVVRKEELHRRVWPDTFVSDATLVGLIKELRRAVDDRDSERPIIRTTHGVGYAFAGEFRGQLAAVSAVSCWIVAARAASSSRTASISSAAIRRPRCTSTPPASPAATHGFLSLARTPSSKTSRAGTAR